MRACTVCGKELRPIKGDWPGRMMHKTCWHEPSTAEVDIQKEVALAVDYLQDTTCPARAIAWRGPPRGDVRPPRKERAAP